MDRAENCGGMSAQTHRVFGIVNPYATPATMVAVGHRALTLHHARIVGGVVVLDRAN
jgi:hypothetical protein